MVATLEHLMQCGFSVIYGYTQSDVQLSAGDYLFFYTDGVVEAENEAGEEYGPARLEQLLLSVTTNVKGGPDAILHEVETAMRSFRDPAVMAAREKLKEVENDPDVAPGMDLNRIAAEGACLGPRFVEAVARCGR